MFDEARKTSRIILIASSGRVLMLLTRAPDSSNWHRWVTPGGGVDPGESHEGAAVRELREETGLVVDDVVQALYRENIPLPYDEAVYPSAHQEFFVVRVDHEFEPDRSGWTDSERVDVTRWRWWAPEDFDETTDPFEPAVLPELLRRLNATKE